MNFIKLAAMALIAGLIGGLAGGWLVSNQSDLKLGAGTRLQHGIAVGTSTAPVSNELLVGAATRFFGTTTDAISYDGFVVGGPFSSIATTSAYTLYTYNKGGSPAFCNADTGVLYANGAGVFAPGLTVGVGTSTGSVPTNNLISTTTNIANVATSTSGADSVVTALSSARFLLSPGESIIGMIGDSQNAGASSTYYTNWTMEFKVQCWLSET